MGEYSPGLPYPWPIHFPIHYPSPTPIPPFSQYVPSPQDISILPGLSSPQRAIVPSTFYPPQQIFPSNPDCVQKRKKKILQIINPSTKEEIFVERSDNHTPTDSLTLPNLSDSPKYEKIKKQQEFRQMIACAAIKDLDLSPQNKIKDEFRFKVSEALIPPLLDDEISHEDTFNDTVEKLQNPTLSNLIEIPSMEFPNSSLENAVLDFTTNGNFDTSTNLESKQACDLIEPVVTLYCGYSRNTILFLQPDISSKCDVPGEIELCPYFCICTTNIFFYNQSVHLLNNLPVVPAKSREKEKMNDKLTWILNRITPENYEKLSKKAIDLVATAETISDLENFIHCIFSKSINEPIYCEFYARLCNDMAKIFIREDSQNIEAEFSNFDTKQVTFRRCLLTICQQEFEKDKNDNDQLNQMKLGLESCTDTILKSQLEEEYYLKEKQVHKHSLGNVRLIGQLYRLNMLSENIIHECTVRLLKGRPTDDYLEELCSLFNVVGMDIDKPEAKDRIDQYFERIQHLMNRGFMSTRVKYLLMNLIDLRLNGWCERREKEIPKTLDELHSLCPSKFQTNSLNLSKDFSHSQLIPKSDQFESPYSSSKISTSRLPSLKKQSNEFKFRPSGNWSNQYEDLKSSFKPIDSSNFFLPSGASAASSNSDSPFCYLDEISELDVIKASTSILKEYDHLNDFDEVRQFLLTTYSPPIHPLIICGFFLSLNVTGGKLKSTLIELLVKCYQQGVILQQNIIDGVTKVIKRIFDEDIQEDCPLIFDFIFVVLFSMYSQITELSLISLINAISISDNTFEIIHLFLQISHDNNSQLLVSMITDSKDILSDDVLSYLKEVNSRLYLDFESCIYLSEPVKNQVIQMHNSFNLIKTEQIFLDYLSKAFIGMDLTTYMKPTCILEVIYSYSDFSGEFEILRWIASSFSSALTNVPSHFHSLIFLNYLRKLDSTYVCHGNSLRMFLSLPLIREIMTIKIIQFIIDHEAVCSPVKDIIRSIFCN